MPLRLDVKKLLQSQTDRVKAVDLHPNQPWVLSALYSGKLVIHDYNTQSLVKSIEVSQSPLRCACFIVRKQWIICGCDDTNLRVYHYNTLEKLKVIPAHSDYIRSIAIHPTSPYALSSSDDVTIKLWDWEADWICLKTFDSHLHYVMMVKWNPKDPHIFASASLDKTIKIWGTQNTGVVGSTVKDPHFTLTGHKDGVNCIEYSRSGERPYIISGSDDRTVRVWDYQTKQCLQVLSGHTNNVSAVMLHPHLPIIISGAEDGTMHIWHSSTFQLEKTLALFLGLSRIWHFSSVKGASTVAIAFDAGTVVIKLGSEAPVASLHGSKILWVRGSDVYAANLKPQEEADYIDGEMLDIPVKLLGNCEMFPQSMSHHPNGRFIVVCDDNEYTIYTSQALRNKSFGSGLDFIWGPDGSYATRTQNGRIIIFRNFQEVFNFTPPFLVEEMFGGQLIGLKSADFIFFYDWQDFRLVRRIDVAPRYVWWAENGNFVTLACADSFYILSHDKNAVLAAVAGAAHEDDEGIEISFELIKEVNEKIETAVWVSEFFVFITSNLRLQTYCAGKIDRIAFLEKQLYILGFVPEQNRLFLMDRDYNIFAYKLYVAVIEYQGCIARKDLEAAEHFFEQIPEAMYNRIAKFLEHQGYKQKALEISRDSDHRFELALWLDKLDLCSEIIRKSQSPMSVEVARWKQLGDKALEIGQFRLAIECFENAEDYNGLFFIYSAVGDADNLLKTAKKAEAAGKTNVAFQCFLLLQDLPSCIQVLMHANRYYEAALFALTYMPSKVEETVAAWKHELKETKASSQTVDAIATPATSDLFPDFDLALQAEKILQKSRQKGLYSASCYTDPDVVTPMNVIESIKSDGAEKFEQFLLSQYTLNEKVPPSEENAITNGFINGDAEGHATPTPDSAEESELRFTSTHQKHSNFFHIYNDGEIFQETIDNFNTDEPDGLLSGTLDK